ncbi:ATP-dependent DNA helicase [Rhizobacter sp. Root404]|uniref:ATP-dependent DNA helicase n=1 Tax=Rhizobacter sp. Root404 TaxID=1736528 RepID=UPI0006F9846A|nr:ATP-dependent DNA helicase [Rhizobacter sp. Root404]KQW37614.1 ATP-dependent DNA helicase [Rhizobacter sp. Root404]
MSPFPLPRYTIGVRELCEFAAKQGDLDLRFTPSPTAQEGMAGHRTVAGRRPESHRSEVTVSGTYGPLTVRGRVDGFDPARGVLEEVKTHKGDVAAIPANHRALHWAQAKVYGWLVCAQFERPALTVSLVYFDVVTQAETVSSEACSADDLRTVVAALCERFIAWSQRELQHRAARDDQLRALAFPHADYRAGQRRLAEHSFLAARRGRCLLAEAPTGIGKTIATLFGALKSLPDRGLDRLFFLSAKNSGHAPAFDALAQLGAWPEGDESPPGSLRVLQLVARDTACEHPDLACHGESCPLARGFYDRLPAARQAAVATPRWSREAVRGIAAVHRVCPYYLAQELARWADVVVADYHYYFDASALLHGLTLANQWRVTLLVDEAHNLLDRARAMYSAALSLAAVRAAVRAAPPPLATALRRVRRSWPASDPASAAPAADAYEVLPRPPEPLLAALRQATAAIGEHTAGGLPLAPDLMALYFDALRVVRLAESFGAHSIVDLTRPASAVHGRVDAVLCLRNVVPAAFLKARFETAHATVLFSATLSPHRFYADVLGLPDDTACLTIEPPYRAAQLSVEIIDAISTRYAARDASVGPIAALIGKRVRARPGNYLAFFSSLDYLDRAFDAFVAQHPDVPAWRQTRAMSAADRAAFLARFVEDGHGVGFAVLGGSFGEGIDLPGTRLVGAFIATLGLPQFNPVNEQMRRTMQATFGAGFDYVYLLPGLRKVIQAAGRVIRTPTDEGCVLLIDDRYRRPEVQHLLPRWWRCGVPAAAAAAPA